mmetsp:Transcript_102241/g.288852  ORF Transcript_102241/g.288852 Transcript_102241/m.288852 type:complete len:288 (-) Transcript_102241:288-1151(-)
MRDVGESHAREAFLIPQSLMQALAKRDRDVLRRVVVVDVAVAVATHCNRKAAAPPEISQDAVQHDHSSGNGVLFGRLAVEVDLDLDRSLLGAARPRGEACRRAAQCFLPLRRWGFSAVGRRAALWLHHGACPVEARTQCARESLEGRLYDVVRVVPADLPQREVGTEGAHEAAPEDFCQLGAVASDPLAPGFWSCPIRRQSEGKLRGCRLQLKDCLREGLVQWAAERRASGWLCRGWHKGLDERKQSAAECRSARFEDGLVVGAHRHRVGGAIILPRLHIQALHVGA